VAVAQPEPEPPTEDSGLSLHHIGVRFGGLTALDDVSLRIPPKTIVGVIGPNGAGKTTLFNVVCGFTRPANGEIVWDGRPINPRPHRLTRLGIARTLQGIGPFGSLTVLENVLAARNDRAAAEAALERCDITEFAHARPAELPYAVRKRMALARALVTQPRMLLLDEPAGGLSADEIARLARLISELDCAVLLVEHHMDFVMAICHEILVLDFGKPVAFGTPGEIRADPAVAEAYLGEAAA
jgi:branched-chain amino acid transport system ATP-binding protein